MTSGTLIVLSGRMNLLPRTVTGIPQTISITMENENEPTPPPVYTNIDDDTLQLIEVALNCMMQLSDVQMDEAARENVVLIADEIAARFAISAMHVEEEVTDDGETIYKPRGGVFNDLDDAEEPEEEDKTLD